MKKHSPAPWKLSRWDDETLTLLGDYNGTQIRIAHIYESKEDDANANLIVVAPDLLAQLDNTITALESVWNMENIPPALIRVTIDEARAVMKKVTG